MSTLFNLISFLILYMNRLEYAKYLSCLNEQAYREDIDIIIIDDFEMNNYILKKLINKIDESLKVETVNKAEDLMNLLMIYKPKLLFCDILLDTSFSSMKLIEDLRDTMKEVKIIAYSGLEVKFIHEHLPGIDVLDKPISIEKVKEILANNI